MIRLDDRDLVGRARERAGLAAALDATAAGHGGGVVVLGEAGLGKSRLRREAEALARDRGVLVLSGRCVDGGTVEPFRPLSEALASGFRASGPPDDPVVLAHRATLAKLVPAWSTRPATTAPVLAVAEALLTLLTVAGRGRGALLSVEDLHWADTDTIAVLEYLVDNAEAHGACCLVTLRPEPAGRALEVARQLADRRAASLLELGPLAPADMDELVRASLEVEAAPADLLAFVRARADGVPFLAEELLLGLERAGALRDAPEGLQYELPLGVGAVPGTLAESIERRLGTVGTDTRRLLAAAALLGRRFDWQLLARITGLDDQAVLAGLREAATAHLLEGDGDAIRFRHTLTRDHVVATLLPPERVVLAERALAVIEGARPEVAEGHWSELAADLAELAGRNAAATRHLLTAARRARDRGALATATSTAERALGRAPVDHRADVHALLAELHAASGDVDTALAHAARAGDDPTATDLPLAQALVAAGRPHEAHDHVERAARMLPDAAASHAAIRVDLLRVQIVLAGNGDLAAARELAERIVARPDLTPPLRCEALELLGRAVRPHDVAAAEAAFAAALATAEAHDLDVWRARALHELGTIDLLDRMRVDRLEAARRAAIEAGTPATAAVADLHLAAALIARGETADGRAAAERAEALAQRLRHATAPWATLLIARAYAQERRTDDAEAAVARALADDDDPALAANAWGHVRAMGALHLADRGAALHALDRAAELLRAVPGHHDPHRGLWALLRTLARDDDAAARAEAAAAAGSDTRYNRAMLVIADAVVAGRVGETTAANANAAAGLAILDGYAGHELLTHLTTWLIAPEALTHGWGSPVAWLQAAVRWFATHGYEPLATDCRRQLRDADAPVPRQGRGGSSVPDGLLARGVTTREADVLWLVAERFSNAEIAERLVLSPRTVEKHVASLLRKTGSHDRKVLAEVAAAARPVAGSQRP